VRTRASKYAVFFILLGTSFFWSPSASAESTGQTVLVDYKTFINTNNPEKIWYYDGVVPITVGPSPKPLPSLSPILVETVTMQDTQTVIVDTSTSFGNIDTSTLVSETVTVIDTGTATSIPVPEPVLVVPSTPPAVEPQPTPAPVQPTLQPEPSPQPTPVAEPAPEPAPVEVAPLPEEIPLPPEPVAEPAPVPEPESPPVVETEVAPEEPPAVEPEPAPEPSPEPEIEPVIDIAPEPPMVEPSVQPEEPPLKVSENATEEEKQIVAQAIIEQAHGEPVTAQAIQEAGLTYADLPPETPVEVRQDKDGNEVVITAEVAVALEVLANPAELINAIFTDPAQALLALGSIGADMSTEERAQSQKTVVAAVIVGQIAGQAAVTAAAGAAAYRRKP